MCSKLSALKIPIRAYIALLIFTACFISYMLRVDMSINLLAMVEHKPHTNTRSHTTQCPRENSTVENANLDYGPRYPWDSNVEALILGAYFWGYVLTSMPGGLLAEFCGPTRTVLITTLISSILTSITPWAATYHYSIVIGIRLTMGLLGGVIYPALHCLVAHWAPPNEKGKFVSALLGGTLGTVLTWPILGRVIESWGWNWAFYIPGIIGVVWCCIWMVFTTDTPDEHKFISEEEVNLIKSALGDSVNKKKTIPPYCRISLSLPFWALTILHFGNLWGLFFLMTAGPKYMAEALGFHLGHSGILAALPYLVRLISGILFGLLGDLIRSHNWMSVTKTRKVFVLFSHILPGILLLCQLFIGCNATLSVALITLSLGLNGAATLTNLQNPQDLAPNYAGTLYGLANCIGSTSGFISPAVTGYFTSVESGIEQWRIVFIIGATIYILCAIIFLFFGSGEVQSWNSLKELHGEVNVAFDSPTYRVTKEDTKM